MYFCAKTKLDVDLFPGLTGFLLDYENKPKKPNPDSGAAVPLAAVLDFFKQHGAAGPDAGADAPGGVLASETSTVPLARYVAMQRRWVALGCGAGCLQGARATVGSALSIVRTERAMLRILKHEQRKA